MRRVYWITTAIFVVPAIAGGVADIFLLEPVREAFDRLGFPHYLARLLGVLKLLGAATLLAPRLPLLKEWAFAGFAFDLLGATVAHVVVGDAVGLIAFPIILAGVGAVSYLSRPEERRLTGVPHWRASVPAAP